MGVRNIFFREMNKIHEDSVKLPKSMTDNELKFFTDPDTISSTYSTTM